jgi:glyoxylase-like metal-dependent hydrolase (beta-lactamase superfamily II)
MIEVLCIVNGYLEENCYIIHNNKYALIVDPGSEKNKIINKIEELKLKVLGILITHYHDDHVGVLNEIKEYYSGAIIFDYKSKSNIEIKPFKFEIIKNYGHTMDSVSFYFEKYNIMFTGDFVFKNTIGKYDIENESIMVESLKKFKSFDDEIKIYPGHGEASSVGYEKKYNYFIRSL